jgi:hypothetical protein
MVFFKQGRRIYTSVVENSSLILKVSIGCRCKIIFSSRAGFRTCLRCRSCGTWKGSSAWCFDCTADLAQCCDMLNNNSPSGVGDFSGATGEGSKSPVMTSEISCANGASRATALGAASVFVPYAVLVVDATAGRLSFLRDRLPGVGRVSEAGSISSAFTEGAPRELAARLPARVDLRVDIIRCSRSGSFLGFGESKLSRTSRQRFEDRT